MCPSLNPQKSIRIDALICDAVQAYALAHRLALKPRWFSNFINSAVREKLVSEGFLPADSYNFADGSLSSRDDFINQQIAKQLARAIREEGLVGSSTNGVPADGSRRVLGGSANSAVREKLVDSGVLLGNPINDTSDGSRRVLDGSDAQGGGVVVPAGGLVPAGINLQNHAFCGDVIDAQKARDRIAQSEESYLARPIAKHPHADADNQDNYPRGFNYPQNPPASVLNGEKVGGKAGVVESQSKAPSIDGDVSPSPNMRRKSSRSTQNRKAR